MTEGAAIALRFALYLDLLLLFGLAAYPLYAASPSPTRRSGLAALAALGIVLSIAGFGLMTAQMAGVAFSEIDRETLRFVMLDTTPGSAFLVRTAALTAATALALASMRRGPGWLIAGAAASALATLAWTGHAAVTEGAAGALHRLSDIIHLLAAGAWIGALAMLLKALVSAGARDDMIVDLQRALVKFGIAGSVMVALVAASGLVNGWMIVGPAGLPLLPGTLYGQLLIAKLALFAAMLLFAAVNRWRLTPRLVAARASGDAQMAVRALRTSIALEAAAAVLIIALVAWLGTLAPPSGM